MIFIHCYWVSTRWQWSINLYKNRKERAICKGETIHQTIQKHRIHTIENKTKKHKKNNKLYNTVYSDIQVKQEYWYCNAGTPSSFQAYKTMPSASRTDCFFLLFEKLKMLDVGLVLATRQFFIKVVLPNNLHILSYSRFRETIDSEWQWSVAPCSQTEFTYAILITHGNSG